jgi:TRAP-type C4-dicarboxylate transport system permease small subunit
VVQFNGYAILWITFLGTAWILSKDKHISMHVLTSRLSKETYRKFRIGHDILGSLLCMVICYYCTTSTWDHFTRHIMDHQAIIVQKAYVVMIIPLGFLLLALQFIRRLVEDVRGGE